MSEPADFKTVLGEPKKWCFRGDINKNTNGEFFLGHPVLCPDLADFGQLYMTIWIVYDYMKQLHLVVNQMIGNPPTGPTTNQVTCVKTIPGPIICGHNTAISIDAFKLLAV